jgi:hypothetical protein
MGAVTQKPKLFCFSGELVNIHLPQTRQSALAKFIDDANVSAPNTD